MVRWGDSDPGSGDFRGLRGGNFRGGRSRQFEGGTLGWCSDVTKSTSTTFPSIDSYPISMCMPPQPTQTGGRFRLRSDYFACELKSFACETILFRQPPLKPLKSLGYEISDFATSSDFKGLRRIFFRGFFRRLRFPIHPSGLASISFF
jgi:hypothetical protein